MSIPGVTNIDMGRSSNNPESQPPRPDIAIVSMVKRMLHRFFPACNYDARMATTHQQNLQASLVLLTHVLQDAANRPDR